MSAEQVGAYAPRTHDNNSLLSVFGYLCIYLAALFFSYLTIVDPAGVATLTREDGWVENLTAISLFLAGILLSAAAWMERNSVRRYAYVLGGLAMVFGAGEEISWGQRIFGFATPDFFLHMNHARETNIHNLTHLDPTFRKLITLFSLLLCVVTIAAFSCDKKELFRIPLPSIFLVLCFSIVLIYKEYAEHDGMNSAAYYMKLPLMTESVLLVFLLFLALFRRKAELSVATLAVLVLLVAHAYTDARSDNYPLRPFPKLGEIREFLFGLSCLFYAIELFCRSGSWTTRHAAPESRIHPREGKSGGRTTFAGLLSALSVNLRSSTVNGICALMIAGSIGLAALGYFSPGIAAAFVERGYSRIKDAEPIIRSEFDVYLIGNQLIYARTPCAPRDKRWHFFLRVVPTDTNSLPRVRRKFGTDKLDSHVHVRFDAAHPGGRCLSIVPLPDYDIAGIRTGQLPHNKGGSWREKFRFGESPG